MGRTRFSAQQVSAMTDNMALQWKGESYDIFSNNCCSFSRALCQKLVNQDIPDWVDRLAQLAANNDLVSTVFTNVLNMRPDSVESNTSVASEPYYANALTNAPFGFPASRQ